MTIKAPVTIALGEPLKAADGSAITTLTLHADGPYPYQPLDLSPLAAFKNLRRVELRPPELADQPAPQRSTEAVAS